MKGKHLGEVEVVEMGDVIDLAAYRRQRKSEPASQKASDCSGEPAGEPTPPEPAPPSAELLRQAQALGLDEHEALVLELRFGLDSGAGATPAKVAEFLGIDERLVVEVEKRALESLGYNLHEIGASGEDLSGWTELSEAECAILCLGLGLGSSATTSGDLAKMNREELRTLEAQALWKAATVAEKERSASGFGSATTRLLRQKMNHVLGPLPRVERTILELRFGLLDGIPKTLAEVAEQFDLTRGEVRQIETRALRKLRPPRWHH